MQLPFTVEQFFDTFRRYNEAVWPAQWVLYALALVMVALALRGKPGGGRVVSATLAFLWLWMAVAYHFAAFREVNPAATVFGAAFIAQAGVFAWIAARRSPPQFQARGDVRGWVGALLVLYALAAYPAIGYLLGHRYPFAPTFGVPCPTTIFTFGLLLWATTGVPRVVLVVPALWALLSIQAVLVLGVREDIGLLVAAVAAVVLSVGHRQRPAPVASDSAELRAVTQ